MRRLIFILLAVLLVASCRSTGYLGDPPVETHSDSTSVSHQSTITNNVYREREVKDSTIIIYKDSIQRIEHWHYERDYTYEKYLQSIIDSILKIKQDSVPYPVPVYKEVPAKLNRWQQTRMTLGDLFILVCFISLVIKLAKRRILS